jgi:Tfp pilus assembly protein PilO
METGLEGKPIYVGAITLVLGIGVIVFCSYYFLIKNMQDGMKRQRIKLNEVNEKINEGRTAEKSLPQFREEVRRLELELDKLLRILPSQRKTDDLLRRVRALTEQGDFDLISFAPGSPRALDDFYSEWAIKIQLSGDYHNLALFFDRIKRFRRIINIEDLRISPARERNSAYTINADFTAKTFLANETEETEDAGGGG